MRAFACVLVACVMLAGPAAATTPVIEVEVAPGPEGQNPSGDGYYVRARAQSPQADDAANPKRDCSSGKPSGSSFEAARKLTLGVVEGARLGSRVALPSGATPECVVMPVHAGLPTVRVDPAAPQPAVTGSSGTPYAAWNVTSGNLYATTGWLGGLSASGRAPAGYADDCEDCPPVTNNVV